jgi:hypothetical protein
MSRRNAPKDSVETHMESNLFTWLLRVGQQICGSHSQIVVSPSGPPTVGNFIVASLAGVVTLFCFIAALRMLASPGERDPNHPKYRILNSDR